MSKELILKTIDEKKKEFIQFLKELIQINSFNPPGNEKDVAIKIQSYFDKFGIKSEIFSFEHNRANLFASLNNNYSNKNLLYNAHMDVVPPGMESEWDHPPLSGHSTTQRIYGRGATDMKGGLAAMVIAFTLIKQLDIKSKNNIIFNAVADEETGGKLGTEWCINNILKKRLIKVDFTIIGEPSGIFPQPKVVILGEKGRFVLKVVTNGISSHSSTPFLGKNAITMMSEIINSLTNFEDELLSIKEIKPSMTQAELEANLASAFPNQDDFQKFLSENPYLKPFLNSISKFTQSLNMINGGIKDNVIPDQCTSLIDIRLLPNQTPEITIRAFKNLITKLGYEIRDSPVGNPEDVFVYLEVIKASEASFWDEWKESSLLRNFSSIIERIYKLKPIKMLFPASSDAHFLRNSGYCPETILFGPGNGMKAHTTNEWVSIDDFINSIKVYSLFAHDFLSNS